VALSPAEWAAFVGSAAWLPHVGTWIHKAIAKPTLTIIPDKFTEIGFTTFGPIFNLRLALAVDKKDMIVTKLGLKLKHENGEQHEFSWRGMTEIFSEIKDKYGNQQGTVEKDQAAIALKVVTTGLSEKFFRFHEDDFSNRITPAIENAKKHEKYLRLQQSDFHEQFLASEKFSDLQEAYKTFFWWQAGTYKVVFSAESAQKKMRITRHTFKFVLTQADVDALHGNLEFVRATHKDSIKIGISGYQSPKILFNWRFPPFQTA